jgi:hypothetical protein
LRRPGLPRRECIAKLLIKDAPWLLRTRALGKWWAYLVERKFANAGAAADKSKPGKMAHMARTACAAPTADTSAAARAPRRRAAGDHAGLAMAVAEAAAGPGEAAAVGEAAVGSAAAGPGEAAAAGEAAVGSEEAAAALAETTSRQDDAAAPKAKRPRMEDEAAAAPSSSTTPPAGANRVSEPRRPRDMADARQRREYFASAAALELMSDPDAANNCCVKCVCFVTATSTDYWFKAPVGGEPRIDALGLRKFTTRTSARKNMLSFDELVATPCNCSLKNNCHQISRAILEARYREMCACTSRKDENVLVTRILVDELGRRSGVCLGFLEKWLGYPRRRALALLVLIDDALEHGVDLKDGYVFLEKTEDGGFDIVRDGAGRGKIPPSVVERIRNTYHLYSRTLPDAPFRRFTQANVDSIGKLYAELLKQHPELEDSLSLSTFRRALITINSQEGLAGLQHMKNDHNVDKFEKAIEYALDSMAHREAAARLDNDTAGADDAAYRRERLQSSLEAHRGRRWRIRTFKGEVQSLARKFWEERSSEPGFDRGVDRDWATVDGIAMFHQDDKSAVNLPIFKLEGMGMGLERFTYQINGSCDLVRDWMHYYIIEMGHGSKNSSSVIDELLLNACEHLNGEKVLVICMDCASLNQNSYVMLGLPQLLVDLGIAKFVLLIFFWQYDSKDGADRWFGILNNQLEKSSTISVDQLGLLASQLQTRFGESCTARIVEPNAMSNYEKTFKARYHCADSFFARLGMKDANIHIVCAGDDIESLSEEAVVVDVHGGQMKTSLREYIRPLQSGERGVVRCSTFPPVRGPGEKVPDDHPPMTPPAEYEFFDYLVHRKDASNEPIDSRLPTQLSSPPPGAPAAAAASPGPAVALPTAASPAAAASPGPAAALPTAASPAAAASPGPAAALLEQLYNNKSKKEKAKNSHTASQVDALGFNCFLKIFDLNFASELRDDEYMLFPGGIEGYDPNSRYCSQANFVTRAPSATAHYPRPAFRLARDKQPEHHTYAITPIDNGWPRIAVDERLGRSLSFGVGGGALGDFTTTFSGTSEEAMRVTPKFARLLGFIAARNGRPLATPPCCSPETEAMFDLLMKERKRNRESRASSSTRKKLRTGLDFFKEACQSSGRGFEENETGAKAAKAEYGKLDSKAVARYTTLAAKAAVHYTLESLEDTELSSGLR